MRHFMNKEFFESIEKLKDETMGTENVCYLLYSMIKMIKPNNVLEIGIGYTTPFILQAIRENINDFNRIDFNIKNGIFNYNSMKNLKLDYYQSTPLYRYTGVDNMSHKNCKSVVEYVNQQTDVTCNLHLHDYNSIPKDIKYDFVWMDCGDYIDYVNLLDNFTTIFSNGAFILLHNTANTPLHNLPNITEFIEPNKVNQNSVSILKYVKSN